MSNDYFNPPNSVWPNGLKRDEEGYVTFYPLGTNKVDISTITWPEGDKLVSPFVYQNDKLVGFVDTKALTVSGSATTTMNYNHIEADFASISEGKLTVNAPNATVKKFSWSVIESGDDNVVITLKYKDCKTAEDVIAVDPAYLTNDIVDGVWAEGLGDLEVGWYPDPEGFWIEPEPIGMFAYCDNLTSFTSELPNLTDGTEMFGWCENLTSWDIDLPSLTIGDNMFHYCPFTSFSSDLSSLTNGEFMFTSCLLTSFSSNLPSLTDAYYMFGWCEKLTSFPIDLPSLTDGYMMFSKTKLDAPSVKNIIDTINTYSADLTLGMGCDDTTADRDLFAQEVGYADMTSLLAALESKGWEVTAQYNGRPATTYSLRRPSENTLPVFVKLEETEKHADYTSEDGSKKYMLNYFHETTGSAEGYTQFASLEEAVAHYNIKPIERN